MFLATQPPAITMHWQEALRLGARPALLRSAADLACSRQPALPAGHKIVPTPAIGRPKPPAGALAGDDKGGQGEANKPDGDYRPRAARTAALTSPRVP
jgi:hypothetical protein